MEQKKQAKEIQFKGYCIGVLQAAHFMQAFRGEDTIAEELISELLDGEKIGELKRLAKKENIKINWKKFRKLKKPIP